MRQVRLALTVALAFLAVVMTKAQPASTNDAKAVDAIAESYVKLVLAMGERDADYVDAFYGPPEWKSKAAEEKKPLDAIGQEAVELVSRLRKMPPPAEEIDRLRLDYLVFQLSALDARVRMVEGSLEEV